MSKPNNIRKKALDHVKKRQWDKALVEFTRLVEIEQQNPNLFNEIGDIHLKLADKRSAFQRYHQAIDAYARVGLNNNAIAVCKKILRLNPHDSVVYGKMATLRQRQGFGREAVAYSVTFLDKILVAPDNGGDDIQGVVEQIVQTVEPAPEVLERSAAYFEQRGDRRKAGLALEKLEGLYVARGMNDDRERVQKKMESIGYVPDAAPPPSSQPGKDVAVEPHADRTGSEDAGVDVRFSRSVPPHIRRGHGEDVATDFGVIDVSGSKPAPRTGEGEGDGPGKPAVRRDVLSAGGSAEYDPDPSAIDKERLSRARPNPSATPGRSKEVPVDESRVAAKEYEIPGSELNGGLDGVLAGGAAGGQETYGAADITGGSATDVKADVDEDDYRSHYDLGMAYLEMGLLTEAIREFQFAANSPAYQVRSLEMAGRCFINQNQPKLAIKQLAKGLDCVENDDRGALGIKYSLALAYEMIGDIEKAKTLFEDVYVVDVTFRDVQDKVKKYTS